MAVTDLLKLKGKSRQPATRGQRLPVSSSADVAGFLAAAKAIPRGRGEARMIFALDATASRQPTWDMACKLQADMFLAAQSLGGINVQLCYFRGFGDFQASSWQDNADDIARAMTGMQCQAGMTQLERVLRHALAENSAGGVRCLVYIGDAMEENLDVLAQLGGQCGLRQLPIFLFQEGADPTAQQAFRELCRLSGGAYCQFDAASAGKLAELLRAVAVFTAGGLPALRDFGKTAGGDVKLLTRQLDR